MEDFKFLKRLNDFRESHNYQIYNRIRKFRLILYAVRLNNISLSKSFKTFHVKESDPLFWSDESPFLRWNVQKRVTTDILNYFSSISSVIDISRKFAEKELNPEAIHNYKLIVIENFEDRLEFKVLKKLRNYLLHYSLLDVGVRSNWNYKEGKSKYTYLSTKNLLEWDGWNMKERNFLSKKGKYWNIEPIIYDYNKVFLQVQDILLLLVVKNYEAKLKELVAEITSLYDEDMKLKMTHNIPFRKSRLRHLKYLLNKIASE